MTPFGMVASALLSKVFHVLVEIIQSEVALNTHWSIVMTFTQARFVKAFTSESC